MQFRYACGSQEHLQARRQFLGTAAAAAGGLLQGFSGLAPAVVAAELERKRRQLLVIFLDGGLSQFESWDPKPGTDTGGPFRAIATSVPGLQVSELLPHTAKQMHQLSVVRSVITKEIDHEPAKHLLETGRSIAAGADFPHLGAAAASFLSSPQNDLPPYVVVQSSSYFLGQAGFLDSRFAGVMLENGQPPRNLTPPPGLSADDIKRRTELRQLFDQRFGQRRRSAETEAYTGSYRTAERLAARKDVFDLSKESPRDIERYGSHDFGRHCLLARRLIENGVTCVQVRHRNYDSHVENFNYHLEKVGEFDQPFATLISDLADRRLLDSTLVLVMSEMGRSPRINKALGRDHWCKGWSLVLGGCGIQKGTVYGKTDRRGTEVIDGAVNQADLFHTFYTALGLDSARSFEVNGRSLPIADPGHGPISELLV